MYCAYQNCRNLAQPFSKISFFTLPTDSRREIWIENSGNELLRNLSAKTKKVFCELHFDSKDMRKQFMRTTLRKDAVPLKYRPQSPDSEQNTTTLTELIDDDEDETAKVLPLEFNRKSDDESLSVNYVYILDGTNEITDKSHSTDFSDFCDPIEIPEEEDVESLNAVDQRKNEQLAIVDTWDLFEEDNDIEGYDLNKLNEGANEIEVPNKRRRNDSTHERDCQVTEELSVTAPIVNSHQIEKTKTTDSPVVPNLPGTKNVVRMEARETTTEVPRSNTNPSESHDEETLFALSLVGTLKRLAPQKLAAAKCHILTYLMQLEYGDS